MSSFKYSIYVIFIIGVTIALGWLFVADTERPFSLGLDLAGGTQLTYTADTSDIPPDDIAGRVETLQQVIERRINALGVSEPAVYTAKSSALTGLPQQHRLIIELPGVTDVEEAIRSIGKTPFLEFKLFNQETEVFDDTELHGGHIRSAEVQFLQGIGGALTQEPIVTLYFNGEGGGIFADLTRENVGNIIGIFIDGEAISTPVIRDVIAGGTTQISGNFSIEEAKELSDGLNFGALPLAIELSETRTVSPTLGGVTIDKSILAGSIALILIAIMFIIIYRALGFIAIVALSIYAVLMFALFKAIPVVLTAAGLAGFIMSVGFAIDANVLIFERMREEFREGKHFSEAVEAGFQRAWAAIRDANATSIIIALLLFWFGTSLVKGFAFTFLSGVIVSMISAFVISRLFLRFSAILFPNYKPSWGTTTKNI